MLNITYLVNGKKKIIGVDTSETKQEVIKGMDLLVKELSDESNISYIISVMARDDSIEFVTERISNIPLSEGKSSQIWFGDIAKFIVFNLI